jgi:hypothetical protein
MQIKKVKVTKEGKISMEYTQGAKGLQDEYTFTCSQKARPEFYQAFSDLRTDVIEICELDADAAGGSTEYYLSRITVKGVSFSYGGEDETMGAVLIAELRLDNSNPLNLITPHKPSDLYGETGDPKMCLSADCIEHLEKLTKEAELYIKGDRAQASMFGIVDQSTGEILTPSSEEVVNE